MIVRGSRLALFLTFVAVTSALRAADETPAGKTAPQPHVVAVFELNGLISDAPLPEDPLFGQIGGESLRSLLTRVRKAGDDSNVAAVVFLLGSSSLNVSQIEELHQALKVVKEKKPVYAHADSVTTGQYAILCGASRAGLSPTGDCWVTGIYGEQMYLKGLLQLLGIEADFLTCGDYKSAAEMFTRSEPSPEAAEMSKWLYDGMFESMLQLIADGRGVDVEQARTWIDQGLYSAETALEAKLIDAVETREALTSHIKREHGATVKFDKDYGKAAGPNLDLNSPFAALQLWSQLLAGPKKTKSTKNAVAVIHLDGPIMLGESEASMFGASSGVYSEAIRRTLDEVAAEPRIRAVVLRINSPGGSATASEIMLQAIMNLQGRKPVVVSMGEVAASGGYYVACRAERIFADSSTITGSIGVVAGKLATTRMWERIGVRFSPIERGKRAGMLLSGKPFTAEERDELQGWMDDVYEVFKTHVVEGRGDRLKKPIDDIAGGRVYTGKQALDLGLVDEIGTLHDAIGHAAARANLEEGYEIRTYPEATNFLEQLLADVKPGSDGDDKRLSSSLWSAVADQLQDLDPARAGMVRSALRQLDILSRERVMLTAPVIRVFTEE